MGYKPTDRLNFGKNQGFTLAEIWKYEPTYISWLILNVEDFYINIESFKSLPKPTPLAIGAVQGSSARKSIEDEEKMSLLDKLKQIDAHQFSVKEIKKLKEGGVKLKAIDYWFPSEVIEINNKKLNS